MKKLISLCLRLWMFFIITYPILAMEDSYDASSYESCSLTLAAAESSSCAQESVERPLPPAIPDIAIGYKEDFLKFVRCKLICRHPDNPELSLEIKALESKFNLSGYYSYPPFSIYTGYKKELIPENKGRHEIWFVPRFLIEKNLKTTAKHFAPLFERGWFSGIKWEKKYPFGIFWTLGTVADLRYFDYLFLDSIENIGSENLYEKWKKSTSSSLLLNWVRAPDKIQHFGKHPESCLFRLVFE